MKSNIKIKNEWMERVTKISKNIF